MPVTHINAIIADHITRYSHHKQPN